MVIIIIVIILFFPGWSFPPLPMYQIYWPHDVIRRLLDHVAHIQCYGESCRSEEYILLPSTV